VRVLQGWREDKSDGEWKLLPVLGAHCRYRGIKVDRLCARSWTHDCQEAVDGSSVEANIYNEDKDGNVAEAAEIYYLFYQRTVRW
jgi:hypothetical protein